MQLFKIYCGLDTKGRLTLDQARKTALGLAADYFPQGHTVIEATGRWLESKPRLSPGSNVCSTTVTEPTIIVEVLTDDENKVRGLAGAYKVLAFQESVLITRQELDADFV